MHERILGRDGLALFQARNEFKNFLIDKLRIRVHPVLKSGASESWYSALAEGRDWF